MGVMGVLISYEESHHVYRDAIENALRMLRPHVEVAVVDLGALGAEVERLEPHLVVCSRSNPAQPSERVGWFKLSPEPDEPSEMCLDGQIWELTNPGLEDLLRMLDETEKLVQRGRGLRGC